MSLPTVYTEAKLLDFMLASISSLVEILDWSTATVEVREALHDTLLDYFFPEAGPLSEATDIRKLRALAEYHIWVKAERALTSHVNTSGGAVRANREALKPMAVASLERVENRAKRYLPGHRPEFSRLNVTGRPRPQIDEFSQ